MLLQALYQYAEKHKLLEDVHLDKKRKISFMINVKSDGEIINVIPLFSTDRRGNTILGQPRPMPRFPGENNGGKAHFLADSCVAIFGFDRKSGESIPAPQPVKLEAGPKGKQPKDSNSTKAFVHFWQRIETAWESTRLPTMDALLKFRVRYLHFEDGLTKHTLPFIETKPSRAGKPEVRITGGNDSWPLDAGTLTFRVNGKDVFDGTPDSPLVKYWRETYCQEAWGGDAEEDEAEQHSRNGLCLVTGHLGVPIARSHKPKLMRLPDSDPKKKFARSANGYIVSFAAQAPAFSSYGFVMGENAPVSFEGAAGYALALQALLDNEYNCLCVGPIAFCFWARESEEVARTTSSLLKRPTSKSVKEFMDSFRVGAPDRVLRNPEQFYSVALSCGKARVVVRHWLQTTVDDARRNFKDWFNDLQLVPFGRESDDDNPAPPLSLYRLAATTVRDPSKELDADALVQLYHAALNGHAPPLALAKLILDRLHADLAKYGAGVLETPLPGKVLGAITEAKQPMPPLGESRMALLKLILNRHRKEGDPQMLPQVFPTNDPAYNCGRLLAVLEAAQEKANEYKLQGAGVAERFFAAASTMPARVFPYLLKLNLHHLRKISRLEKYKGDERFLREQIQGILALFAPEGTDDAPKFRAQLDLHAQGRFALGFYQQKAKDEAERNAAMAKKQHGSGADARQPQIKNEEKESNNEQRSDQPS